jgi:acetyl-CoA C-acetyltransferase
MAESIKDKVAIVGMGCTKFGERWDASARDLLIEAAYEAYEDAKIEPKDIQMAYFSTCFPDLTGITAQPVARALKLQHIPIVRVENACASGQDAIRNAAYAVAAGVCDIAMAIGVEKNKDTGFSGLGGFGGGFNLGDSAAQCIPSATAPGMFANLATRYFARYGLSPEEGKRTIGMVSVKSHWNGARNPKAHFQREVSIDRVMAAPIIAWPLGLYDCCGVSDGAAAAILTRADMAKNFKPNPMFIKALQICVGGENTIRDDFDFTHVEETYRAGCYAYEEAGIKNPREEISMCEFHDCFSITEAVGMEDLQFSPRGKVREDIDAGFFELKIALGGGRALPVQPDGGLKCFGHPIGASGIRMAYEMYLQLQGRAGPRQIKNPKLGLTHNLGGAPCGCTIAVNIYGL